MKVFAETERCILREILPEDVEGMYDLDSNPEVHRYLGNKPITDKEQAVVMINFIKQQYVEDGIGRWAVVDKNTHEFMGWTGLKYIKDEINHHINFYDIGYRFRKKYWGKGIATETAQASLKYAFDELGLNEVYALADVDNVGSNKVLKKIGLRFIEEFDFEGTPHNWYKILRTEFEQRNKI